MYIAEWMQMFAYFDEAFYGIPHSDFPLPKEALGRVWMENILAVCG